MEPSPLRLTPNPALAELPPYTVGRPEDGIDLILDFNECLAPPAPLEGDLHRYPETRPPLQAAIAARLGVAADAVLVTCGADDALERAVRAVTWAGRRVVVTDPTYGMIRRYATAVGAEIRRVPWWRGGLPVAELAAAVDDATALVAVVSPSNPTGLAATRAELERLLAAVPRALVIVDQAYVDFAEPEHDLTQVALAHANAVLVRTFSKAWGAAGLRVGYAAGDPRVVDWMRRIGLPFPVSRPSAAAAAALLEAGPDRRRIERIRGERVELARLLDRLGAETWPSEGSFVLARFGDAGLVFRGLAGQGIAVRNLGRQAGLEGCLRITLPGDPAIFARLCRALEVVLAPEALLLDMDGVLADVSGSYRAAMVATAAEWGVTVSAADIARVKAAGEANNDWVVTRRLLAEGGVTVDLDEVTRRFEAHYQGDGDRPGLWQRETLMMDRGQLEELARGRPLAVVTGRPRRDAERFLASHGLDRLIEVVVCMEDAPAKPDPAPVRVALERLGVERAWLVGDTPDDVRAARAAGVLAVGVPAPGEDPHAARETLLAAGAATVLTTPEQILEVLP